VELPQLVHQQRPPAPQRQYAGGRRHAWSAVPSDPRRRRRLGICESLLRQDDVWHPRRAGQLGLSRAARPLRLGTCRDSAVRTRGGGTAARDLPCPWGSDRGQAGTCCCGSAAPCSGDPWGADPTAHRPNRYAAKPLSSLPLAAAAAGAGGALDGQGAGVARHTLWG
jgi:hypothetical protein